MKTFLFLALCVSAYAAPLPPFPTAVKRTIPLLSPKAASVPKSTPMFKPSSVNPPVPMMVSYTSDSEGRITLIVDALKAANTTLTFDYGLTGLGPWEYLAFRGTYPETQWVGIAWLRPDQSVFVRVTPGEAGFTPVSVRKSPSGVVQLPASKKRPVR